MWNSALLLMVAPALWAGTVEIRLLSHVTSDATPAGTPVRAIVVRGDGSVPVRSILHGSIVRTARVRWGIVRERALVQLRFHEAEYPGGMHRRVQVKIVSLDNTREQLSSRGTIRGVLAASTPGGWVRGIWHRPRPGIFGRAAIGLTGAAGTICSRASLGPIGAAGMFAARTAIFRLPEPEIHLGPGAEMTVELDAAPVPHPPLERSPESPLREIPASISKNNGHRAGDVMNVALLGTREEVEAAFAAAGWYPAEPLTRSSFSRAYRSWVNMHGYPTAPVSPMLYQGRRPDLVFQKSFNTIAKRHHIRIWETTAPDGRTVWLGAATHDTGIAFSRRRFTLTHRIDPRVDVERDKVLADLDFAGCIRHASLVDRPDLDYGPSITTDGALASVSLGRCAAPALPQPGAAPHRHRDAWPVRIVRRASLESRHYLLRGNIYYYGYRGTLKAAAALRAPNAAAPEGNRSAVVALMRRGHLARK